MTICILLATVEPGLEFRDKIRALLLEQVAIVRTEPGCEYYDLYDQANANLVFVEAWNTRELWMIHNDAETVKTIIAGVEGKLLKLVFVQELYSAS